MTGVQDRTFWDDQARTYARTWEGPGRRDMAQRELEFVSRHAQTTPQERILDIGIGTGRLLEHYLAATDVRELHGVDIAREMVAACRERFSDARIKGLVVADASSSLPFRARFDFISAVRVLKYSERWRDAIGVIADRLDPFGVTVFTMPNRRSINRFSRRYGVPWHSTTIDELHHTCAEAGLAAIEIRGFTRLPYSLYARTTSALVNAATLTTEGAARSLLGPTALARELFVAARRL